MFTLICGGASPRATARRIESAGGLTVGMAWCAHNREGRSITLQVAWFEDQNADLEGVLHSSWHDEPGDAFNEWWMFQ